MDIAALRDAVIAETGAPHLSAMIERAVKSVILTAHKSGYYLRDLVSDNNVIPGSPSTEVSQALPTRFRMFDCIELVDLSTGVRLEKKFDVVTPDSSLQFDGSRLSYCYWVEGSNVILKSYDVIQRISWSWYQNPDLSATNKTTWITTDYEQDLIDGACAYVYLKRGDKSSAQIYASLWSDHLRKIVAENTVIQI